MPAPRWPTACPPPAGPPIPKADEVCGAAAVVTALAMPQDHTISAGGRPPRLLDFAIMDLAPGCSDRSMPKPVTHRYLVPLAVLALLAAASAASAQPQSPMSADEQRCAGLNTAPADAIQACSTLVGSGRYAGNNLAIVYSNRGIAHARAGDFDRAIADFDQAVRLNPSYTRAYVSRGNAQLAKRDFDRAIASFDQAIRLDPRNAATLTGRGSALAAKGEHDRAIADFDSALKIDPNYGPAYLSRG